MFKATGEQPEEGVWQGKGTVWRDYLESLGQGARWGGGGVEAGQGEQGQMVEPQTPGLGDGMLPRETSGATGGFRQGRDEIKTGF